MSVSEEARHEGYGDTSCHHRYFDLLDRGEDFATCYAEDVLDDI
jgi:hypothetical protein